MPNNTFFDRMVNLNLNRPFITALTEAIDIQQRHQNDDYREMMDKSLHERVSKGHTITNLDVKVEFYDDVPNNFCPMLPGSQAYIRRVTVFCGDNVSRFRAGAPVVLSHGGRNFKMTIDEDLLDRMVLVSGDFDVKNNYMDKLSYPRHGWEINEDHLTINQRLLSAACNKIAVDSELRRSLDSLLNGTLTNEYTPVTVKTTNNVSQDTAVKKALGCSHYHIIQGPPGTGKTYTIARIVERLLAQGRSVFVTGPTHTAINNCLNAVSKLVPNKSKIVKIGEKHGAEEILSNPYVTRKTRLPYKTYEYSDLSKSGIVIGSTPYALCYPASRKLEGWAFDYVIIDEAAQMSIPLALAAMTSGKKFIFVGDHKQLDPIMPSGTGNWLFDKSIFKHLVDKYPGNVTMLDQSYRLSESLVRIPTTLFYNGKLRTALDEDNREYIHFSGSGEAGRIIKTRSNEVLYLHHEFDALGRSPYEAKLSADIVDDLTDNGVKLEDIAVITPYRAQVREVKKALVRKGVIDEESLDDVFVDTIERMQGQEKDYVIFTLANSNPSEVEDRLEFFYSPNRLNVAITRAKTKCIVIANEKVFQLCKGATANNPVGIGKKAYLDYSELATKVHATEVDDNEDEW